MSKPVFASSQPSRVSQKEVTCQRNNKVWIPERHAVKEMGYLRMTECTPTSALITNIPKKKTVKV